MDAPQLLIAVLQRNINLLVVIFFTNKDSPLLYSGLGFRKAKAERYSLLAKTGSKLKRVFKMQARKTTSKRGAHDATGKHVSHV